VTDFDPTLFGSYGERQRVKRERAQELAAALGAHVYEPEPGEPAGLDELATSSPRSSSDDSPSAMSLRSIRSSST
jgi:hypothetical protein